MDQVSQTAETPRRRNTTRLPVPAWVNFPTQFSLLRSSQDTQGGDRLAGGVGYPSQIPTQSTFGSFNSSVLEHAWGNSSSLFGASSTTRNHYETGLNEDYDAPRPAPTASNRASTSSHSVHVLSPTSLDFSRLTLNTFSPVQTMEFVHSNAFEENSATDHHDGLNFVSQANFSQAGLESSSRPASFTSATNPFGQATLNTNGLDPIPLAIAFGDLSTAATPFSTQSNFCSHFGDGFDTNTFTSSNNRLERNTFLTQGTSFDTHNPTITTPAPFFDLGEIYSSSNSTTLPRTESTYSVSFSEHSQRAVDFTSFRSCSTSSNASFSPASTSSTQSVASFQNEPTAPSLSESVSTNGHLQPRGVSIPRNVLSLNFPVSSSSALSERSITEPMPYQDTAIDKSFEELIDAYNEGFRRPSRKNHNCPRTDDLTRSGTLLTPYLATRSEDTKSSVTFFQSISAMPEYRNKSFEELRIEDYNLGNRGIYMQGILNFPSVKPAVQRNGPKDDSERCVFCLEAKRSVAFVPCGHVAACEDCINQEFLSQCKECPICRKTFLALMKIYL